MSMGTTKHFVAELFRSVDTDKNGVISPNELKIAMQKGSVQSFDDRSARMMLGMFDQDCNGTLDNEEFYKLFNFYDKWISRFITVDNNGAVDESKFVQVLKGLGYYLSPSVVNDLMHKYEKGGKIEVDGFMKCGVLLNALDSAFRGRDTDHGREIIISFEELLMLIVKKILL